ncbi:MAG: flagellar export chaperone FlgN [Planctomycetota bacterium]|jgi:hypothetical protein
MSDLRKHVEEMTGLIEEEIPLMHSLLKGMRDERSAFVAARPSNLERIELQLGPIAEELSDLEARRRQVELHIKESAEIADPVTVSKLLPLLPGTTAERLRRCADECGDLARELQVEQALGTQLLAFSHQAQDCMYRDLMTAAEDQPPGYGKDAKTLSGSPQSGQLISGLI